MSARKTIGGVLLLALMAASVAGCATRENYHPSFPQQSILDGPDRSQEWYKTNDDGK